jgi:hypothetical protein
MQSLAQMLSQKVTPFSNWERLPSEERQGNGNNIAAGKSIDMIRNCLSEYPQTIGKIAKATGLSYTTVAKHIEKVAVRRGSKPFKWVRK